jgi:hypothetical protein
VAPDVTSGAMRSMKADYKQVGGTMSNQHFHFVILYSLAFFSVPQGIAMATQPSLTGEFPFEGITAIYSGPFTHADRSDFLGIISSRLVLFSFDGAKFQQIWANDSPTAAYSMPSSNKNVVPVTVWCAGDFNGDGRYTIITCNVNRMWHYTFVDSIFEKYKRPMQELIQTPDSIWIDQMIACDINDDGKDEIVTLNYPDNPDSCCRYHVVIYRIEGNNPAGRSLVEIGRGPERLGGNFGIVPPNHFISKCRIDGMPGEVAIEMGPQSDVSLSSYLAIGMSDSGGYEIKHPFPQPPQTHLRKGERGAREEYEHVRESTIGPVDGVIFNDRARVLHYGIFLDYSKPNPEHNGPDPYSFSILENGHWRLLQKDDPDIGGLLTSFTIAPPKSGWLFIKDGKYYFYDKLPVRYQ